MASLGVLPEVERALLGAYKQSQIDDSLIAKLTFLCLAVSEDIAGRFQFPMPDDGPGDSSALFLLPHRGAKYAAFFRRLEIAEFLHQTTLFYFAKVEA